MKVGDLVQIIAASYRCHGIIMGSDMDPSWVNPSNINVFILEGKYTGEIFYFEEEQLEVISEAR
jgi:hypothetical protein|tara:strand:+ start:513 stop:704 length:192 start_codon:yes stop_codon:yes gene_type:complete